MSWDVWGGSFGATWGVTFGQAETVAQTGGGSYRYWAPEPVRKPKKRKEKVAVIEAIVSKPVFNIDLSELTDQLRATLEAVVPDYRSIVQTEKAKPKPEDPEILEIQAEMRAYAERIAEEARVYASEVSRHLEEEMQRRERKKRLLAEKRERNMNILSKLLN